jgi:hypothetical protein
MEQECVWNVNYNPLTLLALAERGQAMAQYGLAPKTWCYNTFVA